MRCCIWSLASLLWVATAPAAAAKADDQLAQVLQAWVDGSRDIEPPTLQIAQARFGEQLSVHQLEAAIDLWTPDSRESLTSRFEWSITSRDRETLLLAGIPVDEVDRVFIGRVEVTWNLNTQRPTGILFAACPVQVSFASLPRPNDLTTRQAAYYPAAVVEGEQSAIDGPEVRTASAVVVDGQLTDFADSADADVNAALQRWADASSTAGAWELRLNAYDLNHVFGSEQQYYAMMRGDGQGTIEIRWDPRLIEPGEVNHHRLTPSGAPYRLQSGPAAAWVFTPDAAIFANVGEQTLRRLDWTSFDHLPWHKHPLHTPSCMTYFLPVHADDLLAHYDWSSASQTASVTVLRGTPKTSDIADSVSVIEVELSTASGLPRQIRCFDASGNHEHVMQLIERVSPVGLTADIILEGYVNYAPAREKPSGPR
jgi:hypothetical protein